jgi:hypothetical protein
VNLIIGGEKPQNIREFTQMFVEALLTFWIARFKLDAEILPTLTIDVMVRLEEFLSNQKADLPSMSDTPLEMAMNLEMTHLLDDVILNGDPVTSQKLALVAEQVAMICATSNWMTREFIQAIDELSDDEPDLL